MITGNLSPQFATKPAEIKKSAQSIDLEKFKKYRRNQIHAMILAVLVVIFGTILITITVNSQWTSQRSASKLPTLRLGLVAWPGYEAIYVGLEKGFFRQAGVNVEHITYYSLTELSNYYVQDEVDVRGNLSSEAIRESSSGLKHKIILAVNHSNGADALIGQPGITDVTQLKGKRVAYEKGTISEYFLAHILERYGLKINDVNSVDATSKDSNLMLLEGHVDAAVSNEPFMGESIRAGTSKVLFSSNQAPGVIVDILTASDKFLMQNPDATVKFIKGYYASLDYINSYPNEAAAITASKLNLSPDQADYILAKVHILNQQDNIAAFTVAAGEQSLYRNLRKVQQVMQEGGLLGNIHVDTDRLIEPKYVNEAL